MKIKSLTYLLLLVFITATTSLSAQKFGYLNSAQLLTELPEVKAADSELQAYQQQLVSAGETMVKSFETKYQKYSTDAQSGEFSPVQVQQKEAELAEEQKKIQEYEVEVTNKIAC